MVEELYNYYKDVPELQRSCLLALRSRILTYNKDITETQKWGMPCFCYKANIVCYLWTDKKTGDPYILFAEGKYIDHPLLESGSRSRMKIFRVDPDLDLPVQIIEQLLGEALRLCKKK
jgi:hypothetical protein